MTTALPTRTEDELRDRLTDVCRHVGISADTATLIKYTMNAVFRVGDYVVRLARGDDAQALAQRTTVIAAELARRDVPTIRLATELAPAPVHTEDWVATFWHYVATAHDNPWPVDLAAPLRALHTIDRFDPPLPAWDPIHKIRRRITNAASLPESAATEFDQWCRIELCLPAPRLLDVLHGWCDEIDRQLPQIRWHFPPGPTHGDAHTGNLLLRTAPERPSPDPTALLCDLDGISEGPLEWDLLPTAHGTTRFGRSRKAYDLFADAYGYDILTWNDWPHLVRLRELKMVTSDLESFTGRPTVANQLAVRLKSLLAEDTSVVWTRHH